MGEVHKLYTACGPMVLVTQLACGQGDGVIVHDVNLDGVQLCLSASRARFGVKILGGYRVACAWIVSSGSGSVPIRIGSMSSLTIRRRTSHWSIGASFVTLCGLSRSHRRARVRTGCRRSGNNRLLLLAC